MAIKVKNHLSEVGIYLDVSQSVSRYESVSAIESSRYLHHSLDKVLLELGNGELVYVKRDDLESF
jgi:hypothetical protein